MTRLSRAELDRTAQEMLERLHEMEKELLAVKSLALVLIRRDGGRGPQGADGPRGAQGVEGPRGPQGIQGEPGEDT